MSGELIGLVTCPPGKGPEIAQKIVSEGLAACVNIVPTVRSIYAWQGEIQDESEELLLVKTHKIKWKDFEKRMKELHPYDVPEIICIRIEDGYQPYLEWIKSSLLSASDKKED